MLAQEMDSRTALNPQFARLSYAGGSGRRHASHGDPPPSSTDLPLPGARSVIPTPRNRTGVPVESIMFCPSVVSQPWIRTASVADEESPRATEVSEAASESVQTAASSLGRRGFERAASSVGGVTASNHAPWNGYFALVLSSIAFPQVSAVLWGG